MAKWNPKKLMQTTHINSICLPMFTCSWQGLIHFNCNSCASFDMCAVRRWISDGHGRFCTTLFVFFQLATNNWFLFRKPYRTCKKGLYEWCLTSFATTQQANRTLCSTTKYRYKHINFNKMHNIFKILYDCIYCLRTPSSSMREYYTFHALISLFYHHTPVGDSCFLIFLLVGFRYLHILMRFCRSCLSRFFPQHRHKQRAFEENLITFFFFFTNRMRCSRSTTILKYEDLNGIFCIMLCTDQISKYFIKSGTFRRFSS